MKELFAPYQRRFYVSVLRLLVIIVRQGPGILTDKQEREVGEAIRLTHEIWPGLDR